jgi:hypothetical protein
MERYGGRQNDGKRAQKCFHVQNGRAVYNTRILTQRLGKHQSAIPESRG